MSTPSDARAGERSLIERVVNIFLHSKLSLVLILLAVLLGAASLLITPRRVGVYADHKAWRASDRA